MPKRSRITILSLYNNLHCCCVAASRISEDLFKRLFGAWLVQFAHTPSILFHIDMRRWRRCQQGSTEARNKNFETTNGAKVESENEIELSICVLESKYHLGNSCGELGRAVASNTIFLIFGKSRFPPKKSFITSTAGGLPKDAHRSMDHLFMVTKPESFSL